MSAPPLFLTPVPLADVERGDAPYVNEFVESYCRITKDSVGGPVGELLHMRQWQTNTSGMVYARRPDGRLKHREALIGLPRKNGKSALGSSFGLYGLVMGSPGSEVYSCAADKDQARIVFGVAKAMVEADPFLSDLIRVYRDALEYTDTGSVYKVLSSEAFTKEGLNPTTILFDELHALPNDELYNVMAQAQGARRDPLFIIITTAGVKADATGQDSICYRRYQYGCKVATGEITDPSFFMAWWGAPEHADYKDPQVWEDANPGYGDLIDPEDFVSVLGKVSEADFRTKRLNQWVAQRNAWLPQGAWARLVSVRSLMASKKGVVLGFDGSKNGDCTALVAVTVESRPHVAVLGLWERPQGATEWTVPRASVRDAIREACRTLNVREIAWDEFLWLDSAEELTDEGLPVVVFPQNMARMGPATQRFYELVRDEGISHDGNPALARHIDNATTKTDIRGTRLVKDAPNSPRKIDLAIAAVMACQRASWYLTRDDAYGGEDKPQYALPVYARDDSEVPDAPGTRNEHIEPGFVW